MRIAVTGTHGVGKTTLIGDFLELHRAYQHVPEAYWELVEQGVVFPEEPSVDGFLEQLEHSIATILGLAAEPDLVFDRCPLDFIAYLEAVGARTGDGWMPAGRLLARVEAALATLDLIVLVPLERRDFGASAVDRPKLRRAVDARLKGMVRDDALGLLGRGPRVVVIGGSRRERVAALNRALTRERVGDGPATDGSASGAPA